MVEEVKNLINLKETLMMGIRDAREEIAGLKERKATWRSDAWSDAQGTAKEKEDYVKSVVAEIDKDILIHEADIELWYNQIKVLDDKIDLEYLTDE